MRSSLNALLLALAPALLACTGARAAPPPPPPPGMEVAVFAGGCFWCTEADFEKVEGVLSAESGYAGGPEQAPTYKQVAAGRTGHAEVVRVVFDPKKVSYERLVERFWRTIDPTQKDGQFCDRGPQYRSAIFAVDDAQLKIALASKAALEKSGRLKAPVVTEVAKLDVFWPAEEYHQDFAKKSPLHYSTYRQGCGRDRRLEELWGR